MSSKYKSPLIKRRNIPATSTPVNKPQNLESLSQLESSSSYKSPLIKSRNSSATTSTPVNVQQNLECFFQQESANSTDNSLNTFVVYDTNPLHSFVGQKKFYARSKGSPYQWRSPNTNSCSSDPNGSDTPQEASVSHEYSPDFNKFKKQDYFNSPKLNNKSKDEQFYHPSMLEDPWAQLLHKQIKKTE